MIKNIKIKNNPFFDDANISLINGRGASYKTIILIGENGTFKTKLVKSILRLIKESKINEPFWRKLSAEIQYDPLISNGGVMSGITLDVDGENIPSYIDCKFDAPLHLKNIEKVSNVQIDEKFDGMINANNRSNETYDSVRIMNQQQYLYTNYIFKKLLSKVKSSAFSYLKQNKPDEALKIVKDNVLEEILDTIKDFLNYFDIDDDKIMTSDKNDIVFKTTTNGDELNFSSLCSGESQIVGLLSKISETLLIDTREATCIYAIDEPETNLHPKWQIKIVKSLNNLLKKINKPSQIFITTHSPFLVKNILGLKDEIAVFSLTKNPTSKKIKIQNLNSENDIIRLNILTYSEINYGVFGIPSAEYYVMLYEKLRNLLEKKVGQSLSQFTKFDLELFNYDNTIQLIDVDKYGNPLVQDSSFKQQTWISRIRHLIAHGLNDEENKKIYIDSSKQGTKYSQSTNDFYKDIDLCFDEKIKQATKKIIQLISRLE